MRLFFGSLFFIVIGALTVNLAFSEAPGILSILVGATGGLLLSFGASLLIGAFLHGRG